jgi:3-deoxy-D-manno-octulosonic acid (KDO) 8-phosphate synthase
VSKEFEIGPVRVGGGRLFLIAGPCVIESEAHVRTMAEAIQRIASDLKLPYLFKASYDKANRTSARSFRGPGLIEGTAILRRLAEATGLPVLTDVHEPAHCEIAAEGADVLQIPAFLCRQTDLLIAAGRTGRAINVKKGQFVAPWDMQHAVEKIASTGNTRVFLTERGATSATTTWWSTCGRWRSCAVLRPWFLTERIRCRFRPGRMACRVGSRSLSLCWRALRLRPGSTGFSLKCTTILRGPSQTERTHWT